MQRRPSTQDLTWLLDLHENKQLDLDPPYQRRSVWTRKDKQFFLDSIFRNYPSPAIFLHKTISDAGKATYHVVDGKQRTQTILDFVAGQIRLAKDFGDVRLDGKKWPDLAAEQDLKTRFWNYQITIEQIDVAEGGVVNEVFDRLNRNSRRLTPQELRHAKFEGWLISLVEAEAEQTEWSKLGISTKARAKRMMDCQFISELALVLLEGEIMGFDQDALEELYAKYEDVDETVPEFNEETWRQRYDEVKAYILSMEAANNIVTRLAKGFGHFYSLWALVALTSDLPDPAVLAQRYSAFMEKVETLAAQGDLAAFLLANPGADYQAALEYLNNSRGASTDFEPRRKRLDALRSLV